LPKLNSKIVILLYNCSYLFVFIQYNSVVNQIKHKRRKQLMTFSPYTPLIRSQVQSGKASVNPVANVPTMVYVQFEERFLSIPKVVAAPQTTVPGTTVQGVGVANVTREGFDLYVTRSNTTATSVSWIAALTNEFELNMSLQTDAHINPDAIKVLKHFGMLYTPGLSDDQFIDITLEWTLRDTKGAMIRSGFQGFKFDSAYTYTTPEVSIDFTGLPVGDYRLTHEANVPGFGVWKDHCIIRLNSDGTIHGALYEPYQVD
jgi:hypothetical protein